jgi:hypothetical protein
MLEINGRALHRVVGLSEIMDTFAVLIFSMAHSKMVTILIVNSGIWKSYS